MTTASSGDRRLRGRVSRICVRGAVVAALVASCGGPTPQSPTAPAATQTAIPSSGATTKMTPGEATAYLTTYLAHARKGEWEAAWQMLSDEQRSRFGSLASLRDNNPGAGVVVAVEPFLDWETTANWLRNVATADRATTHVISVEYQTASDQDNSSWEVYAVGPDTNGVLGIWGDLRGY